MTAKQLNESPLVSVIIPAYNCADHIAESIESALAQDYLNKEIIVIDDGSTDNTIAVLSAYSNKIILIQQQNTGSAVARNAGIKAAKGEYIAFLDSDDLWFPGKLSLQVDYMILNPSVGLVYHDWLVWELDSQGCYLPLSIPDLPTERFAVDESNSGWIYGKLFSDSIIHTTSAMLSRELIKKAGLFDEELRKGQDYEYWFRISRYTQVCKLRAVLSAYRMNPQSVTNQPSSINYAALVLNKVLLRWGRIGPDNIKVPRSVIRKRLATVWCSFGYLHYKRGTPWIAVRAFSRALFNAPFKTRYWIYILLSFSKILRGTNK